MWPTSWTTVSRISRTASPRVARRRIGPRKIAIWAGRLETVGPGRRTALRGRSRRAPRRRACRSRRSPRRRLVLDGHDDVLEVLRNGPAEATPPRRRPRTSAIRGSSCGIASDDADDVTAGSGIRTPISVADRQSAAEQPRSSRCRGHRRGRLLTSASFLAVSTTNAGSQGLPRWGTGARYGVSVSTSIASSGSPAAAARMFSAARNVIMPEKDTR